jgi:branched-chain amino acid transport system substrate-binding protein
MISMAANARIVEPQDAKRRWVYKTPQNDIMMSLAIAEHMVANGVKSVGFIGFADAYGEGWFTEFTKVAEQKKIPIIANERFVRAHSYASQRIKPAEVRIEGCLSLARGNHWHSWLRLSGG